MKHKLKRKFVYILARMLAGIIFLLPIKAGVFLGGQLGGVIFFLLKSQRRKTLKNLKIAFENRKSYCELYAIAKAVFKNLGRSAAEFINFPKINSKNIDRFIQVAGVEKINKALEEKNGAVILSCHFGNWELGAAYFGLKGYSFNAIVRPLRDEGFDRLVNSARRSKSINIVSREQSFKKIVSILKENKLIGILPDQDIDSIDGVFVDFFGKPAYTPTGPVLLALASGSPIFPILCIRENGRYKLVVEDRIALENTGRRDRDVFVNTQRWTKIIEGYIGRYPEQWVWMHNRWKTQQK